MNALKAKVSKSDPDWHKLKKGAFFLYPAGIPIFLSLFYKVCWNPSKTHTFILNIPVLFIHLFFLKICIFIMIHFIYFKQTVCVLGLGSTNIIFLTAKNTP